MTEPVLRLVVVGAVVVMVLVGAVIARRGVVVRRHRPPEGLEPGVYLFVSDVCSTCERVEQAVAAALPTGGYRRVSWESQPELFLRLGIERVPHTIQVRSDGGGWAASGVPSSRRLRRWLAA